MIKTTGFAVLAVFAASAALANGLGYDKNEALSPSTVAKVKFAFATDMMDEKPVLRVDGDTEVFSAADMEKIKAAYTEADTVEAKLF